MYSYLRWFFLFLLLGSVGHAHEMTPAYPKFKNSYIDRVLVTTLKLFNRREDVSFYEVEVFTGEWKPVPFATSSKVLKVGLNKTKSFDFTTKHSRKKKKKKKSCGKKKV